VHLVGFIIRININIQSPNNISCKIWRSWLRFSRNRRPDYWKHRNGQASGLICVLEVQITHKIRTSNLQILFENSTCAKLFGLS